MLCKKCQKETRACELHAYAGRCEDCYNEPKAAIFDSLSLVGLFTMQAVLNIPQKKRRTRVKEATPKSLEIGGDPTGRPPVSHELG